MNKKDVCQDETTVFFFLKEGNKRSYTTRTFTMEIVESYSDRRHFGYPENKSSFTPFPLSLKLTVTATQRDQMKMLSYSHHNNPTAIFIVINKLWIPCQPTTSYIFKIITDAKINVCD